MDTKSTASKPTDTDQDLNALAKQQDTLSHKLVDKAEKLSERADDLVVVAKETVVEKKAVEDNLADIAEKLSKKASVLEKTEEAMVGRELKMIEQKEVIANLKKSE